MCTVFLLLTVFLLAGQHISFSRKIRLKSDIICSINFIFQNPSECVLRVMRSVGFPQAWVNGWNKGRETAFCLLGQTDGWPSRWGCHHRQKAPGLKPSRRFPPKFAAKINGSTASSPICPRRGGPQGSFVTRALRRKER